MCRTFAAGIVLVALAAGLSTTNPAADDAKMIIGKRNALWLAAYNSDDLDSLANLYAEDALFMAAGSATQCRPRAVRKFYSESWKFFPKHSITLTSVRVELAGDVLLDSGDYRFDGVQSNGTPDHEQGSYITVFKKRGGEWRIIMDIWNLQTSDAK
jgi:ketosteroid isomerase-like protein